MKLTIHGFEAMRGVSNKSGKPYDMGRIFITARLAPPTGDGIAAGYQGTELQCASGDVVRAIAAHASALPFDAEVDVQTVMRYGKAESVVYGIQPIKAK